METHPAKADLAHRGPCEAIRSEHDFGDGNRLHSEECVASRVFEANRERWRMFERDVATQKSRRSSDGETPAKYQPVATSYN